MNELSDTELLAELGVSPPQSKPRGGHTPNEERIIAGFDDIQRFYEANGRLPQQTEDVDIFERLYAVRLEQLRWTPAACVLLSQLDVHGILAGPPPADSGQVESLNDEALLGELNAGTLAEDDITVLRHVTSREERQAAADIANRWRCLDFERFQPFFQQAQGELESGCRETRPFGKDASIEQKDFFVLGGLLVYVAEVGNAIKAPNGSTDARLRVIYSNGTESNLLLRSLQRALYKDETGRRLTEPNAGPLFSGTWEEGDVESGTIYVLRSLSTHPFIAEHRELVHKIGVTGGEVAQRIAGAANDPTYLLGDVEVVATYKLARINRVKLETLFHRFFTAARLPLTIEDRFGKPVHPQEWFLVPLQVIDEAVRRLRDGSITDVVYDPKSASLVEK